MSQILRERFVFVVRDLSDQSEHEAVLKGKARKLFIRYQVGDEVFAAVRADEPWVVVTETQFKLYPHLSDALAELERA